MASLFSIIHLSELERGRREQRQPPTIGKKFRVWLKRIQSRLVVHFQLSHTEFGYFLCYCRRESTKYRMELFCLAALFKRTDD